MNLDLRFQPKQRELRNWLTATGPEAATILGFGGAKGGGKSAGFRNCAISLASTVGNVYPGLMITLVRRVFNDLKDNHIDKLFDAHPELRQYYRGDDKELTLPNRAKIKFAFAETAGDVERKFRGGFESPFIFVDEAQQFTERELQDMEMAARWTKSSGIPPNFCKLLLGFNPGGKSSNYLRRIFWLKDYGARERPGSYRFMHCFGWDNFEWFRGQIGLDEVDFYALDSQTRFDMFIRDTSEGRKYDAFPEAIRAGYLLGSFDHFENQYFAGAWNDKKNVITADLANEIIQPWWVRWMAQDWGFGDHTSHGWYATGRLSPKQWTQYFGGQCEWPMDVVIRYREYLVSNRAEVDLATDIVARTPQAERRLIQRFYLSQDAMGQKAKQSGEHTVGQQYTATMRRHGLPAPQTAIQDRVNGWRFMYNCLWQGNLRGANINQERAQQGPAFFVTTDCPNAMSYIPMAIRAEKNIEDVERIAGEVWEDVTDEIRYGLMSELGPQWTAPVEVRRQEVYDAYDAPEPELRTDQQMTALSLAMRRFDAEEGARYKRVRRRR